MRAGDGVAKADRPRGVLWRELDDRRVRRRIGGVGDGEIEAMLVASGAGVAGAWAETSGGDAACPIVGERAVETGWLACGNDPQLAMTMAANQDNVDTLRNLIIAPSLPPFTIRLGGRILAPRPWR